MSEMKRILDNAYEHIQHESYNDALSSILEAGEYFKTLPATKTDKEALIQEIEKKIFALVGGYDSDSDMVSATAVMCIVNNIIRGMR